MTDLEKCRYLHDARGWTFSLDGSSFPDDFCKGYICSPSGDGQPLIFFDGMVENLDFDLYLSKELGYH